LKDIYYKYLSMSRNGWKT